jgi:hypothetical protein
MDEPTSERAGPAGAPRVAATGAPVGWADTISHPFDLRGLRGTYGVAIARGFHTPGHDGGGAFAWTTDLSTPDDGGTVVVSRIVPRVGCWKRIAAPVMNVRWFGARGDGVADDLDAFREAYNAAVSAGGGTVYVPAGRYRITAALIIEDPGITLRGDGDASVIVPEHDTASIVVRGGPSQRTRGVRIADLLLEEWTKTWAHALEVGYATDVVVERLHGVGGFNGVLVEASSEVTLDDLRLLDYRGSGRYVRITGGHGGNPDTGCRSIRIRRAVLGGDAVQGMRGIDVDGLVQDVDLVDVRLVNIGAVAFHVRNSVGGPVAPTNIRAHGLACHAPVRECIRLDDGAALTVTAATLYRSHQCDNIYIGASVHGATFIGGVSAGAQQAGIFVAGQDVSIRAMHVKANSSPLTAGGVRNAYAGIQVAATARGVTITGCRSGESTTADYQQHGIKIDAGADELCVTGNVCTHNATSSIANAAGTGTTRIVASNAI